MAISLTSFWLTGFGMVPLQWEDEQGLEGKLILACDLNVRQISSPINSGAEIGAEHEFTNLIHNIKHLICQRTNGTGQGQKNGPPLPKGSNMVYRCCLPCAMGSGTGKKCMLYGISFMMSAF
jgi:hypothetical protein